VTTYIALLRGINVSGKNKVPMKELQAVCLNLGWKEVQTYIQSGNIVFRSDKSAEDLSQALIEAIVTSFGFDVPVLIIDEMKLQTVLSTNPTKRECKDVYYTFLYNSHNSLTIDNKYKEDSFELIGDVVYIDCLTYGKTKFNNTFFEKKLQTIATTRNYKTLSKLRDISAAL